MNLGFADLDTLSEAAVVSVWEPLTPQDACGILLHWLKVLGGYIEDMLGDPADEASENGRRVEVLDLG